MQLKDIVNRDHVTLTNCESEPIHIPGAIQPHGFLLLLKGAEHTIDFCSANAADYCGQTPEALLGQAFGAAFGEEQAASLGDYLQSKNFRIGNPAPLKLGETTYSCTITKNDRGYLLEAEPYPDGYLGLPDLYQQTRSFVSLLENTFTLRELCQTIAEETRRITGYDRVMIYRFDKDYNGEVFAEDVREDLEPFLDLHYPHTDIPAQARELYLRNLLRMIVDVSYAPVPIFTVDDEPGKNLDLSDSVLRSVSPIHIEYLKNMGVSGTLTISLIHEKKLWGLIACHHYSPKNLPHYTRVSAQLQGHFLTSQIAVREANESFEAGQENIAALEAISRQSLNLTEDDLAALAASEYLQRLASATGVCILFNNRIYTGGDVPDEATIKMLEAWLCEKARGGSFNTSRLSGVYPNATVLGHYASGILYHSLSAACNDCVIWFRKENPQVVNWAGDPGRAIVKDEKGLSPRKSFELWKVLTQGESRPWTSAELSAAASFATGLQKQLSLILLRAEEARILMLNEHLREVNAELESVNWISTHDMQEPLRKIQVFASRLLEREGKSTMEDAMNIVRRMSATAIRMQQLVNDINAYTRVLTGSHALAPTELDTVLDDVLASMADELHDKNALTERAPLPQIMGEPFLLKQLFINLLRNALKFTVPGRQPVLKIGYRRQQVPDEGPGLPTRGRYHCILVQDNGIGFSNEHAESIFHLFKRLHSQADFAGTGIGLSICRKVMQRHHGFITAEGAEGLGATFMLWFPVV